MMRPPDTRSPGHCGTGAEDRDAPAIENPCNLNSPRGAQVQRLIDRHALQPGFAALIAPLAFGEAAQ